ncbi:ABC transporter ATP-binding protein [Mycoplasma sp. Mirounga ES2805-ORL]|uniref:ABC transporter ATP-binding protein n=1 Tax=Mycoplasma sp. Mirounga ES2805-ORL TaxID=754514 RepID=UPI00197C6FD8|nr:ABC transporter ATP-binding protein [Mycoplasma sp. Mirounga ES2805-ORL]QSF13787.1 ABC transporter ATP-binding protein [Mycoplasma sp. Mirounga ES2805-ORL]
MNAVEMRNITKVFGTFKANDNITFKVKENTIHALIGENGAGKSTLMSILFGLYTPTSGEILIKNNPVKIDSPLKANMLGIGMVHQHFKLIDDFTVLQNIVLNNEDTIARTFVTNKNAIKKIKEIMDKYNFHIDLKKKIRNCTVAEQQRVEILKMLYRDSEILIFDEPTAVLSPEQIDQFLKALIDLKNKGKTIIIITHKLDELKQVADTGTIIRLGKFIADVNIKDITHKELSKLMVGADLKEIKNSFVDNKNDVVFKIEKLNVNKQGYKNVLGLKNFSMDIKAGEIVGVAGVEGNGQSELINSIAGLSPIKSGKILLRINKKNNVHNIFHELIKTVDGRFKNVLKYIKNLNNSDKYPEIKNSLKSKYLEFVKNSKYKNDSKKMKIKNTNTDESNINNTVRDFYSFYNPVIDLLNQDNESFISQIDKLNSYISSLVKEYNKFIIESKTSNKYLDIKNYKKYTKVSKKHIVEKINEFEDWYDLSKTNIASKYTLGVAHIPEDRHLHGLVLDLNLEENSVSQILGESPYSKFGIISYKNIANFSNQIIKHFDVRSSNGGKSLARGLSGGNQQKFIVGRELSKTSELIIIAQPTRGLDVGAINNIHKNILNAKKQNKAILLISYEIDEIMSLADRVIVLNSGENTGTLTKEQITREKLGELMARKVNNEQN